MKYRPAHGVVVVGSRSPCGERGLKSPPRIPSAHQAVCRSPCGERGLKCISKLTMQEHHSRSPCGERGLKSMPGGLTWYTTSSLPVRGAWIEMRSTRRSGCRRTRSLPVRGAWIEMLNSSNPRSNAASLPVRGAWIEITSSQRTRQECRRRSPCGERGLKLFSPFPVRGAWIEI